MVRRVVLFLESLLLLLVGCRSTQEPSSPAPEASLHQAKSLQPMLPVKKTETSSKFFSPKMVQIVLRVGKEVVTSTDIIERCRMMAILSHREDDAEFRRNVRQQVKKKLTEEAVYEQIAERFKLDVTEDMVKAYFEDYAMRMGTEPEALRKVLQQHDIYDTFIRLIRSQIIGSFITTSASQKDLVRISEKQIDEEVAKIKANERKRQYALSEIVFYSNEKVQAQENAIRTHRELVKMSKQMPPVKAFQSLAQQLSQAPTASDGGYRGWITEDELDPSSRKALKTLSIGDFSEAFLVRPGEYRILYLNNLKEPGYAPHSQARVELCVVSIPLTRATPPDQQAKIQRKVESLMGCTSKEEFEGVAKDFGYATKVVLFPLAQLPIDPDSLKINACAQPLFTGKSLEVFMLLRRFDPPKSKVSIDRKEIKESLEYQLRVHQAEKIVQDFKNHLLIQDYER